MQPGWFTKFRQTLLAAWKLLLSYLKSDWELSDYPVIVRRQPIVPNCDIPSPRFRQDTYRALIVNWWVMDGGGDTPQDAMRNLASQFKTQKANRLADERRLPRPGKRVPIEFSSNKRVSAHSELADDFTQRVLGLEWAWISDESSLWDFHGNETNDELNAKIKQVYGVDVSGIESGNLAEILERIAAAR